MPLRIIGERVSPAPRNELVVSRERPHSGRVIPTTTMTPIPPSITCESRLNTSRIGRAPSTITASPTAFQTSTHLRMMRNATIPSAGRLAPTLCPTMAVAVTERASEVRNQASRAVNAMWLAARAAAPSVATRPVSTAKPDSLNICSNPAGIPSRKICMPVAG